MPSSASFIYCSSFEQIAIAAAFCDKRVRARTFPKIRTNPASCHQASHRTLNVSQMATVTHDKETLKQGSGQPTIEEQNRCSDAKGGAEDKGSCDARVRKQEMGCCNEHVKGCRECDPAHNESLICCCDGRSALVI
jgi:hypothetical protein